MDDTLRLHAAPPAPLAPGAIRYIKLGAEGAAVSACFAAREVRLGFPDIPHELCATGAWDQVRDLLIVAGKRPAKASDHVRELRSFYELGAETLWVTFADGRLWWAFAESHVVWDPDNAALPRVRKVINAWRSTDLREQPIETRALSTRLTSVRGYRATICEIKAGDYLLRKINGQPEPLIEEAQAALAAMHAVAVKLIGALHEKEFELLVDLIFAQSGWRRISVLGETQADVDLLLEQIATGERAFVQVKSRANATVFADYLQRFAAYPECDRLFFVCHSPAKDLRDHAPVARTDFWFAETLATKAIQAGLLDWLIERVR